MGVFWAHRESTKSSLGNLTANILDERRKHVKFVVVFNPFKKVSFFAVVLRML